jgi:hypothetical protein
MHVCLDILSQGIIVKWPKASRSGVKRVSTLASRLGPSGLWIEGPYCSEVGDGRLWALGVF